MPSAVEAHGLQPVLQASSVPGDWCARKLAKMRTTCLVVVAARIEGGKRPGLRRSHAALRRTCLSACCTGGSCPATGARGSASADLGRLQIEGGGGQVAPQPRRVEAHGLQRLLHGRLGARRLVRAEVLVRTLVVSGRAADRRWRRPGRAAATPR
ncbi:hypothetical protein ACJJTC_003677 [Scirpophaga incertulas]